jgi:hypothetical protein
MDYFCPVCPNHVRINVTASTINSVEAWCCTKHPKPVRMELRVDVEA